MSPSGFVPRCPTPKRSRSSSDARSSPRIPEGNEIEVPSVGDRPSRLMQQRLLGEILEPRARELFEMLRDNLRAGGRIRDTGRRNGDDRRRSAPARHAGGRRRCTSHPSRIGLSAADLEASGESGRTGIRRPRSDSFFYATSRAGTGAATKNRDWREVEVVFRESEPRSLKVVVLAAIVDGSR